MYWGRESEIDEEEGEDDLAGQEEVDLQELCSPPGPPGSEHRHAHPRCIS